MKVLGTGVESLGDLAAQIHDFDERRASADVAALAKSMRADGMIHPPLVRQSDKRVIVGRDRIAAHSVLAWDEVTVTHVECTDLEADRLEIIENLRRRNYSKAQRDEMLARLVALNEAQAAAENPPTDITVELDPDVVQAAPKTQRAIKAQSEPKVQVSKIIGRPSAGKVAAVKDTAAQTGRSVATVKRAVAATKATRKVHDDGLSDESPPKPPIELHGLEMPEAEQADIREITTAMDGAAAAVHKAMGLLKPLGQRDNYPRDRYQQLYNELKFVSTLLRTGRPAWVCLDCKLIPQARANCPRCMSAGYIVEAQTEELPEELKRTGDEAGIFVNGKFRKLSEIAA